MIHKLLQTAQLIILVLLADLVLGQTNTQESLTNRIYSDSIKSVKLFKTQNELSIPLISLNSNESLTLIFDDFSTVVNNYEIQFTHCDLKWLPTNLPTNQYLAVFDVDYVTDYQFSTSITANYTAYNYTFPNDQIQFTKSGNYVLTVINSDTQQPILRQRFYLLEPKCAVNLASQPPTEFPYRDYGQNANFTVNLNSEINQPENITAVVSQNYNLNNLRYLTTPSFISDNKYSYQDKLNFYGGNEFRPLDLRKIPREGNSNEFQKIYLQPEKRRSNRPHLTTVDINGALLYKSGNDFFDPYTGGEYYDVEITAEAPSYSTIDYFIYSQVFDFKLNENSKLHFNKSTQLFEKSVTLKQGYYNYLIASKEENSELIYGFEGSHKNTENKYYYWVYFYNTNYNYYELVGHSEFTQP